MKLFFCLAIVLATSVSFGQQGNTQTNNQLFAQCMFTISTQSELDQVTNDIYTNHPDVEMVRLDMNTQRALIITTGSIPLTESDFISWFGQYSSTIHCVQIGIRGVDVMNSYPFTNCQ